MPQRCIIAIGGGDVRTKDKSSLAIEEYIAKEAQRYAGEKRALGLFIPTASHDCMPYYNTFHKVYTGVFGLKTDVALTVNREIDLDKMKAKFDKADFIYAGGGNTVFMIESWKKTGLLPLIREAYERGVLLCGLSAGAICWFDDMYSDSVIEGDYAMYAGLGWVRGKISPHYNERMLDFDKIVMYNKFCAWGVENDAALVLENETPVRSLSCGGKVYFLDGSSGETLIKTEF